MGPCWGPPDDVGYLGECYCGAVTQTPVSGIGCLPTSFSQLAGAAFVTLATGVNALGARGVDILLSVDPTLIVVGGTSQKNASKTGE